MTSDSKSSTVQSPPSEENPKVRFTDFDLPEPLLRAIDELGFEYCTPIQAQALAVSLEGHDVFGRAQTGTGKTAAFLVTIIYDLLTNPPVDDERYAGEPRSLIIAPTRELVMQIAKDAKALTKYSGLQVTTLVGGIDYQKQLRELEGDIIDIVVATPGRLLDFVRNKNIFLGLVELLIIDEGDRMLDMGFIPQVRQIVRETPRKESRQTMMFSATFNDDILELANRWAMDPVKVEVESEKITTESINQRVYLVTTDEKYRLLYNLIQRDGADRVIVFTNRRDQARRLADSLYRHGLEVGLLSGEIPQPKRVKTLENFRAGKIQVLVATDVAGRGLHVDDITHVINFNLPEESDDYIHRIGRTGRAGASGTSVSFACEEDSFLLPDIEETIGKKLTCEHPAPELLKELPEYVRPSGFKSAGGGKGGGGRSKRGGRPGRKRT